MWTTTACRSTALSRTRWAAPRPSIRKFEAFGFEAITVNGNDFEELEKAFRRGPGLQGQALRHHRQDRTKGKGVSFMEGQVGWHGKAPNADAVRELP